MDIIKYRRYIVTSAEYCCVTTDEPIKWSSVRKLIRNGHAYYLNDHNIVIGYQITNPTVNYKVFIPAFSLYHECHFTRVRDYIRIYMKFYVALIRMRLYIKEIDKISKKILKNGRVLPEEILEIIGLYSYDPKLLS